MKILHTADIHLQKVGDKRWDAIKVIIELAKKEEVDVLVIAGDMFNKGINGEDLRPELRKLFEDSSLKTLILPGNHDYEVFKEGFFWGNNVKVMKDYETPCVIENVAFWGLPFEEIGEEEVLQRIFKINDKMGDDQINILIYHGELIDLYGGKDAFGEEEAKEYMPLRKAYFKNSKIKYVLAGHFHKNFDVISIPNGGYFIYPGSPVSITSKEVGKRKVNIFQVGEAPQEYPIDTFHYEMVDLNLNPFVDEDPKEKIEKTLSPLINSENVKLLLTIRGYIDSNKHNITEQELNHFIEQLKSKYFNKIAETRVEVRDLGHILEDELYEKFVSKLEVREIDEDIKEIVKEYVIRAMMGGEK